MMKIFIYILMTCVCNAEIEAQKNINLIISIDDNVVAGSLSQIRLIASSQKGIEQTIEADYYPGNLSLKQSDYDKLLDSSIKTVFLTFDYLEYCKHVLITYNYKIDLKKGWLSNYYYILHIYNTDKSKYKKIFTPLKGKTYTFECDYPGGSMRRIRKGVKEDCN